MSLIKRIIFLLDNSGLKRADLARYLNKSTGQVAMWEKRGSNLPSDIIPQIADFFGVSIDYLYGRESSSLEGNCTYA